MKNYVIIIDSSGQEIVLGDIVKVKNLQGDKRKTFYYLYDIGPSGNRYLFKYNKAGKTDINSFGNIKIDEGVTLNNELGNWCKIGPNEEYYTKVDFDSLE